MKFSLRLLGCVAGIPGGFLPLLAAVETGPAEVGATLAALTVFGCVETWWLGRKAGGPTWPPATFRIARVAAAYAACGILGMLVAARSAEPAGPTAFQRLLFGDFGGHLRELGFSTTIIAFRLATIWLCSLVSWIASLTVVTRFRSAYWLAMGVAPLVFGGLWIEVDVLGPTARGLAALAIVSIPMFAAGRFRRSARRANADQSGQTLRAELSAQGHPVQFSVGALLALVAICGMWCGLTVYARREPRHQRFFVPLPVTGKVTCDGRPVVGAEVWFHPTEESGRAATGSSDRAGEFEAQMFTREGRPISGARAGEYIVTISVSEGDAMRAAGQGGREVIPPRYADPRSSGLSANVEFGHANRFEFDLDSESVH
jgi:hypothetical protein